MNDWIDRVQAHPLSGWLSALEQSLERTREAAQANSTNFEAWERIERIVKFARRVLSEVDPLLVPPSVLNNAQTQIQQADQQVGGFASSSNIAHLQQANNHLDNVLAYLGEIPRLDKAASINELGDAAAAYKKSVGGLVRTFEKQLLGLTDEKNALQIKFQELSAEVSAQKQRTDNFITHMQQQFSTAQETRQTEAAKHESDRSAAFNLAQESRAEESDIEKFQHKQGFAQLLSASEGKHESLRENLTSSSKMLMDSLQEQKSHAEKIVGIISTEAVAHGYGRTANEERGAAKVWRWIAVGALVFWILASVWFFALTYEEDLSWSALARQFLISTPFVLLAGFAALQTSKHQRAERINRQQELEIAAIDPYLATFEPVIRDEVKRALADKLFGQREIEVSKSDSKLMFDTTSDILKVVKQVQDSLKK